MTHQLKTIFLGPNQTSLANNIIPQRRMKVLRLTENVDRFAAKSSTVGTPGIGPMVALWLCSRSPRIAPRINHPSARMRNDGSRRRMRRRNIGSSHPRLD